MATRLLFVNGTLMEGLELHANLAGARLVGTAETAPAYRLYSIDDRHPGMFRVERDGVSVRGELYDVPDEVLARVVASEPAHLYVGIVELRHGRSVPGVLYPAERVAGHRDISAFGGWREYTAHLRMRENRSPGKTAVIHPGDDSES